MIPRPTLLLTLLALAGCAPPGPVVSAPPGGVLLEDRFDGENAGVPASLYHGFRKWRVSGGAVSLRGGDAASPARGLYVSLDGSPDRDTRLTSRAVLDLAPGMYQLGFAVSGSGVEQTLSVGVARWRARVRVPAGAAFREEVHTIRVRHRERGRLWFEVAPPGGPRLDDVVLRRIAE
ncbi:MAG TPA: hypothetical protein VFQ45_12755 [Longimicrobium sp.]|nr:hypothetical protein [Longimicrobium sp.]